MESQIKVIIVGDGAVGKSCWISALLNQPYSDQYFPTQGVSVHSYTSQYQGSTFKYALWDCSGHPNNLGLFDGYYIGAQAAIVMYDANNIHTRSAASVYKRNIGRACCDIPVFVVRNKIDLVEELNEPNQPVINLSVAKKINILEPIQKIDEFFVNKKVIQNPEDANKF